MADNMSALRKAMDKLILNIEKHEAEQSSSSTSGQRLVIPDKWKALFESIDGPTDRTRYLQLMENSLDGTTSMNDWKDLQPGQKPVIKLHRLTVDQICELGVEVFRGLKTGVSHKTVGGLLLLAFNLTDRFDLPLFADPNPNLVDKSKERDIIELSATPINNLTTSSASMNFGERSTDYQKGRFAKSCCFIACSYLRLYSKPVDNYLRIGHLLRNSFAKFYGFQLALQNFHPEKEEIQAVKTVMDLQSVIKNTFYVLLYAGEEEKNGREIKDFLYVMHVAYMGLHPYTLFLKCVEDLKTSDVIFMQAIYSGRMKRDVESLLHVFENLSGKIEDEEYRLQMWKYGRIFDSRFLSVLQTKKCVYFTWVLVYVLYFNNPGSNEGLLKIAQIQDISEGNKSAAEAHAKRALELIAKVAKR
ncbi:hypothetical protein ABFX02_06G168400 [Erythranthe guttata]